MNGMTKSAVRACFALPALLLATHPLAAQDLSVERIFSSEMTAVAPDVSFTPDGRGLASLVRNGSLLDVWVERVRLCARVDDEEALETKVSQGDLHRLGDSGSIREFHLESVALATAHDQKVEFGTLMCTPKVRVVYLCNR